MYDSWHFLQQYGNVMLIPSWSCCHHLLLLTRAILRGGKWWQVPRFISLSKQMSARKSKRRGVLSSPNTELQVRQPVWVPARPLCGQGKYGHLHATGHLVRETEATPPSQKRDEICWEVFAFLAGETYAAIASSSWWSSSKGHTWPWQGISCLMT